ncbi:unnamed protein product [Candida verbasci]|uniref:Topoisomerase I damage affected protein 11 n=1 Tax=Candida verbasci TaxID=1227364 RepID=A0A9W4U123_9ASCO|nr:unnamed protein product [Candida verbasci]
MEQDNNIYDITNDLKTTNINLSTPSRPKHQQLKQNSKSLPHNNNNNNQNDLFNVLQKQHFKLRRSSSSSSSSLLHKESNSKPSRSNSIKNKGINIFAVSPINTTPTTITSNNSPSNTQKRRSSITSPSLPQVSEIPTTTTSPNFDLPLPSHSELMKMEIDEQLRLLAFKEMLIVEIKDSINNLNQKLLSHESELHHLREVIQKSLYQELKTDQSQQKIKTRQRQNSNPREEAIAAIGTRKRSSSNQNDNDNEKESKLWSGLAKPLNYLSQFDNMLQNEFEKSLINNEQKQHQSRLSEDSISSSGSASSPLRQKTRKAKAKQSQQSQSHDDMIQTVSSSIWSFVNEVKSNVLSSLNEPETNNNLKPVYNLDNGSAVSLTNKPETNNSDDENLLNPIMSDNDNIDNDDDKIDFSIYKR